MAVLNQVLIRAGREDQAMMTTLAGIVVVLFIIFDDQSVLFGGKDDVYALKKEALCFRLQLWD